MIDLDTGIGFTTPSVNQTTGTGSCGIELADIDDPVPFQVSLNVTLVPTICFGTDDETTTLSLNGVSITRIPSITVWRGGNGWVDFAACAVQYADWLAGGSSSPYYTCYSYPARIV